MSGLCSFNCVPKICSALAEYYKPLAYYSCGRWLVTGVALNHPSSKAVTEQCKAKSIVCLAQLLLCHICLCLDLGVGLALSQYGHFHDFSDSS